jgi:hypothetical protein
MPDIHLPIGTSSVHRLIACPASFSRSKEAPKGNSSSAADEGTLLHTVMEEVYQNDVDAIDQVGKTKYKHLVFTQDMMDAQVTPAIEATEALLDTIDAEELVLEQFVQYIPELVGGTLDMIAVSADEKTLLLNDYKFGFNAVAPEGNSQILLAALAARVDPKTARLFVKAEKFVAGITQPKVYFNKSATWEFTKTDIDEFEDRLIAALNLSEGDSPPAMTGSHCQWCPAAPFCDEKMLSARGALVINPKDSTKLAEAMSVVAELEAWTKQVRALSHDLLEKGGQVEGWKLVQKRATRVWNDKEAVEDKVRKAKKIKLTEGFDSKLKSPAQLEKVCKAKGIDFKPFGTFISSVSSGTTLAAASDKRPEVGVPLIPERLLKLVAES